MLVSPSSVLRASDGCISDHEIRQGKWHGESLVDVARCRGRSYFRRIYDHDDDVWNLHLGLLLLTQARTSFFGMINFITAVSIFAVQLLATGGWGH